MFVFDWKCRERDDGLVRFGGGGGSSLVFCAGVSWRVEQRREEKGREGREGERSLVLYSCRGFM